MEVMQDEKTINQYPAHPLYDALPYTDYGVCGNSDGRQLERTAKPYEQYQQSFSNPFK